jgi:hypothetical protein
VTSERPPTVFIDDLADPKFPAEIEPIRQMMAEFGATLSLEPDVLLATAVEATGLDDFGDEGFRERLDVLTTSLRNEAGLGPAGVTANFAQLTQLLKNRLLIQDLVKRHPEIDDVEIERPIIICGLPRTGTTHLHNLISADPALRSLPYWESLEPVLADRERPPAGHPDPRLARCDEGLIFLNTALPYFERMHDMYVDHVHEEIQLLAIDLSTMLFETTAVIPSWRDFYMATDQTPMYAYMKRVLRVLMWLRGGNRWVLKSPQHLEQFPVLLRTFPDATFVVTHRDPVSICASLGTMISYTARLSHARVDPVVIGRYWAERLETMLRACVRDRDVLPDEQTIDVRFDEFMADDVAMVERIYALAAQPFTAEVRQAMDAFMLEHPRGVHGGLRYDLSQVGLDRAELRARFTFYTDRFGVALET